MTANLLPTRLRVARWLFGWTILLLTYMLLGLPFPPDGRIITAYVLLLGGIAACVAVIVGIGRGWQTTPALAALLGLFAVYQMVKVGAMATHSRMVGALPLVVTLLVLTWMGLGAAVLCTLTGLRAASQRDTHLQP